MKRLLYLTVIALVAASCTGKTDRKAEHVIFIGLDGWGAYSVEKAEMPNVKALMEDGCYTLGKRSVLPSSSAVNWATMFMGANPEVHGHTEWNSYVPDIPSAAILKNGKFPTVFQVIDDQCPDVEMGAVYHWEGIKHVIDSLAFDYHAMTPDFIKYPQKMSEMAATYIIEKKPSLGVFIFDEPDHIGHAAGHDTPEYYDKLKELDKYIGDIIAAVRLAGIYDDTIFIVTSDHGGIHTGHGGKTLMEIETPFIIAGKNVKKGGEFTSPMMQFDVAATIAEIFGVEAPDIWRGRSMSHVFE